MDQSLKDRRLYRSPVIHKGIKHRGIGDNNQDYVGVRALQDVRLFLRKEGGVETWTATFCGKDRPLAQPKTLTVPEEDDCQCESPTPMEFIQQ
jgi:hypothetical protein